MNYAKPLHTLDLLIFPQNIWTCSCDESMIECLNLYKWKSEKDMGGGVFPAPGRFIYIFQKTKIKTIYVCST